MANGGDVSEGTPGELNSQRLPPEPPERSSNHNGKTFPQPELYKYEPYTSPQVAILLSTPFIASKTESLITGAGAEPVCSQQGSGGSKDAGFSLHRGLGRLCLALIQSLC